METYTVRVDLAYNPWDDATVEEFGHGEPAALVALLDLVRLEGIKLHVFATLPFMQLFPSAVTAVLGDLHDLDLLLTPRVTWEDAQNLAATHHYRFEGLAFEGHTFTPLPTQAKFVSTQSQLTKETPNFPVTLASPLSLKQLETSPPHAVYAFSPGERRVTDPEFKQTLDDLQILKSSPRRNRSIRDLVP